MKEGDLVVAMMVPATICSIGRIIQERYHEQDNNFKLEIIGGPGYSKDDPYGEVWFFNRIGVEWITNPDNPIKIGSLGLPTDLKSKLNTPVTILNLYSNEYKILKNKIDIYEPEKNSSPSKYVREYDQFSRSGR